MDVNFIESIKASHSYFERRPLQLLTIYLISPSKANFCDFTEINVKIQVVFTENRLVATPVTVKRTPGAYKRNPVK